MSTSTTPRSVADIKKQIEQRQQLRDQKLAQAEELSAKIPSATEEGALLLSAHDGDSQAKKKLQEILDVRESLEECRRYISAVDHQLPELQKELNRATLIENMKQEKELGKKGDPIAEKIQDRLSQAAKLYDEWQQVEKARYSLRRSWGARGRTPREIMYNWLRREFGSALYPMIELPPQPRADRKGE